MSEEDTPLFTGEDGATRGGETILDSDQAPLDPSDTVSAPAVLRDLTYNEVHAFVVGFVPLALGLPLMAVNNTLALPLLVANTLLVASVLLDQDLGISNRAIRYIYREAHYYLGGQFFAIIVGLSLLGLIRLLQILAGVVL